MKVEVNETEKNGETPFPKLMISKNGNIVLMTSNEVGTLVKSADKIYKPGKPNNGWIMAAFTDFHGTVTISND